MLVLGDSLSTAYGMEAGSGWVSLLEERLAEQGYSYRVVNASVTGDTSHGARTRLDALLDDIRPELAIVELGGNDGLRGIRLDELRHNLAGIIQRLQELGSQVLLVSIRLPPNYGAAYVDRFERIYTDLGETYGVRVSGFLLDGVALRDEMMQEDGIHPTAEAQPLILDNVWMHLEPMLSGGDSAP